MRGGDAAKFLRSLVGKGRSSELNEKLEVAAKRAEDEDSLASRREQRRTLKRGKPLLRSRPLSRKSNKCSPATALASTDEADG